MMMVPRSFVQNSLVQRQQQAEFEEKEKNTFARRKSRASLSQSPPSRSALSQKLSEERTTTTLDRSYSDPVKIPSSPPPRMQLNPRRPGPSLTQPPSPSPISRLQNIPQRKQSAQDVLSTTTIPIRRKPKQRPSQRIPNGDHVADFSKLLRDDVQVSNEGSISGSWSNPQFEGLFGNIDGLVEGEMIVGSEGLDSGILSARSLSAESMPSLSSTDDLSSLSPATVRSPSDQRLRQIASSQDCSNEHPLLAREEEEHFSGTSTPDLAISPSARLKRRPLPEKKQGAFKSSLTASLRALKAAAQTVSNIATTPPLIQPDDYLARSVFEFRPSLTDDRRPPPSAEPPSAALRRYLNPGSFVPPDSPAQLHFWLDEKPIPSSLPEPDARPRLKIKRKYQPKGSSSPGNENAPFPSSKPSTSKLPPIVQLAICIPSTVRTANASSPPTWLEADGTPSNRQRASQTLWSDPENGMDEGQPRPREPRENRDFLRVFVCEMNMRKEGKLADDAIGRAKLWLPPVEEAKGKGPLPTKPEKKTGQDRWTSWTSDDL